MSDGDNIERRVTAGLRGASWDPELVPSTMLTHVYPLRTADNSPIIGYLHANGGEKTAVFIMHPRELLVTHYMVPHLVNAGYAVWTQGARTVGNDLRLEHETAVFDVAAGMVELKRLGFDSIVMLGNSGGASLFAFYNQQAVAAPEARIARTPGGKPVKLAEAELPIPDGFVFVAPTVARCPGSMRRGAPASAFARADMFLACQLQIRYLAEGAPAARQLARTPSRQFSRKVKDTPAILNPDTERWTS